MKISLKNIARKDFPPTKNFRKCSFHFKLDDFREDSCDQKESCKRLKKDAKLSNKHLHKDTAPCIFKDLPSYYECNVAPLRSGKALSLSRLENDANLHEEQAEKFMEMDKLQNFDDLLNGLKGGESSSQFRWFTIAKIELYFLIFFVLILGAAFAQIFNKYKKMSPRKKVFGNSEFCSSRQNHSSLNY